MFFQTRRCACGKRFSTDNPKHTQCRGCHRRKRQADADARERHQQAEVLRGSLRDAYLAGTLPKSAKSHCSGTQVVVVWMGRSHTFHLAKAA